MRIVVAGIGGVGGYIGGHLCSTDEEILFLARGEHGRKIEEEGLTVREDGGELVVRPDLVTTVEDLEGEIDILLLCVKSYDIEETVACLAKNITSETIIVSFSNGVSHKEEIEALVDAKVLHGAVYILAHKERAGVVVKKGKVFAALFGDRRYPKETALLSDLFERARLRYKAPDRIEEALWKKYLFISAFAALTSYFDTTMRQVSLLHRNWAETLLKEIADVAEAKGIDIQSEIPKALQTADGLPEDASSSMHLDFQKGNRTELETLCGYVVREGQKLRLPTPMMSKIYGVLSQKR